MTSLSQIVLSELNELINNKMQLKSYYISNNQKILANPISFQVKNYKTWVGIVNNKTQLIDGIKSDCNHKLLNSEGLTDKFIIKIIEIIKTGHIQDNLEIKKILNVNVISTSNLDTNTNSIQSLQVITDLQKCYGIGPCNAKKLALDNITIKLLITEWDKFKKENDDVIMLEKLYKEKKGQTIKECEKIRHCLFKEKFKHTKYLKKLNHHQLVGLKYFNDIQERIPRNEIIMLEKVLKHCAHTLDKSLQITICGSYRRGQENSGDIDALLVHPSINTKQELEYSDFLSNYIQILTKTNFIIDHLTLDGTTKYMGLIRLKSKTNCARRIDIRFIPYVSFPYAQLYFTGSGDFNVIMRKIAIKMGYTLNEYGIYKNKIDLLSANNEQDIFKFLNMDYLEPCDRNKVNL
jgi:DNA polymerase/3'-5' exonuclease PolX